MLITYFDIETYLNHSSIREAMEQCKGLTKSGSRCKNTNGLVDGYCRLHRDKMEDMKSGEEGEPESIITEVAENINSGVSRLWLVLATVASLLLFWLFRKKKRRSHSRKMPIPQLRIKPERK
jgi:hypothetical protein